MKNRQDPKEKIVINQNAFFYKKLFLKKPKIYCFHHISPLWQAKVSRTYHSPFIFERVSTRKIFFAKELRSDFRHILATITVAILLSSDLFEPIYIS